MQEETNDKIVSICVQTLRMTASELRAALSKYLEHQRSQAQVARNEKIKVEAKAKAEKKIEAAKPKGKQSMKQLSAYGAKLTNIKITDNNIKSFDKVARKYNIDYSLKKDKTVDPPKYYVFFKAKDADVMTAAFKEYAGLSLNKLKKPSVRKKLVQAKQRVAAKHRELQKTQKRSRGQER